MQRLLRSFGYAISGAAHAFRTQMNFKIHCLALATVLVLSWYFSISKAEWLAVIIVCGMVLMAELFNTALEVLVDFVSPDFNEKAGLIKDLAAAAVLLSAITALTVGLVIFIPKLIGHVA